MSDLKQILFLNQKVKIIVGHRVQQNNSIIAVFSHIQIVKLNRFFFVKTVFWWIIKDDKYFLESYTSKILICQNL